jgi:hypothetical protein
VEQINTALTALVTQLQKLPLPREVARPLKTFAKQLDGRVSQAREIPLLLSELSGLQGQALNNLEPDSEPRAPVLGSAAPVWDRKWRLRRRQVSRLPSRPRNLSRPNLSSSLRCPNNPRNWHSLRAFAPQPQARLPRSLSLQHRPMSGLPAKRSSTRPRLRWRRLRFPSQVSSPGSPSLRQRKPRPRRPRRLYRGTCGSA